MKDRKLVYVLIVSVAFNLAFLGALGYRLWEKRDRPKSRSYWSSRNRRFHGEDTTLCPESRERLEHIRENCVSRLNPIRMRLFQERKALGDLLLTEEPDSLQIEKNLERIAESQLDMEREVAFYLLRVKGVLPSEEKKWFMDVLVKRLGRKHGSSMKLPSKEDSLKHFKEFRAKDKNKRSRSKER